MALLEPLRHIQHFLSAADGDTECLSRTKHAGYIFALIFLGFLHFTGNTSISNASSRFGMCSFSHFFVASGLSGRHMILCGIMDNRFGILHSHSDVGTLNSERKQYSSCFLAHLFFPSRGCRTTKTYKMERLTLFYGDGLKRIREKPLTPPYHICKT